MRPIFRFDATGVTELSVWPLSLTGRSRVAVTKEDNYGKPIHPPTSRNRRSRNRRSLSLVTNSRARV